MIDVRSADATDLWAINIVISAAKQTWNYDPGYLAAALPLLSVDQSYLANNTCFAASGPDGVVGFAAIEFVRDGVALLGHLWVAPVVSIGASEPSSSAGPLRRPRGRPPSCASFPIHQPSRSTCARVRSGLARNRPECPGDQFSPCSSCRSRRCRADLDGCRAKSLRELDDR
jgi:hypothetical protein